MSELNLIKETSVFAKAELDVQISTAKAFPRDHKKFIDDALGFVTLTQEVAESCFYCLARYGKEGKAEIKGPSVRLAEIAASSWGNIHAATRVIENDGKMITAQGVAWDLEKNVKITTEVKRRITGKDGRTYSEDMQVVTGNAACSIALRNAILKVIPRALIDTLYESAIKFAVGDQKTIDSKRKAVFDRLNKIGIDSKRIFDFYGKNSINEFDANDVADLIGVGTSIKEGILQVDKAFMMDSIENSDDMIKNMLGK